MLLILLRCFSVITQKLCKPEKAKVKPEPATRDIEGEPLLKEDVDSVEKSGKKRRYVQFADPIAHTLGRNQVSSNIVGKSSKPDAGSRALVKGDRQMLKTSDSSAKAVLETTAVVEQEEDHLKQIEDGSGYTKLKIVFLNKSGEDIELMYKTEATEEDISFGTLEPSNTIMFNSYVGHTWYSRNPETLKMLQTIVVVGHCTQYVFLPVDQLASKARKRHKSKIRFEQNYLKRTGRPWINVYPRPKGVSHHMYMPRYTSVRYQITTSAVYSEPLPINPTKEDIDRWKIEMDRKPNIVLTLHTKALSPRVFLVPSFLSKLECETIIREASGLLEPSLVTDKGHETKQVRNSWTAWLKRENNLIIQQVYDRVADVCQMPRSQCRSTKSAEPLQVVRYKPNQYYNEHVDYLTPSFYPHCPEVQRGNNRFATFLLYLRVSRGPGGHTYFPYARNNLGNETGPGSEGLKLKPKQGSAVVFYSMLPDGNLDERSLHAGTPVQKGEKWIANIFLWDPIWK